jgi:hypothetical protein
VSSYLQSPPSTSIRPFRPFLESQPLRLRAEFLCCSVLCVKSSFAVAEYSAPVSTRRITKDESSLVICADLVACRRVTTPPQTGDRDYLSVLCIVAPSVACRLSGSLISEKGDTVLFEDSSLWDLANVVGGRWADPNLVFGLDRYTLYGDTMPLCCCRRDRMRRGFPLWYRVLFSLWSQCHLYGINATLGEAYQSVEAL